MGTILFYRRSDDIERSLQELVFHLSSLFSMNWFVTKSSPKRSLISCDSKNFLPLLALENIIFWREFIGRTLSYWSLHRFPNYVELFLLILWLWRILLRMVESARFDAIELFVSRSSITCSYPLFISNLTFSSLLNRFLAKKAHWVSSRRIKLGCPPSLFLICISFEYVKWIP